MKSPFSAVIVALTTLLTPAIVQSAPRLTAPPKSPAMTEAMQACIANHEIAGAVTFIGTSNRIVDFQATGFSDIQSRTPMRMDSLFCIASMTKPITATAILMLQDQGKLSIDDPVEKYIPRLADLKTTNGIPGNVTLRHLLTHTSGMAEATREELQTAKTLIDLVPYHASKPLQFMPGSKWQYCQSGINSLGRVVEVVSGQPFEKFLEKELFKPLGMRDTTFYPTKKQLRRLAKIYSVENGTFREAKIPFQSQILSHDRYPAANGGLISSASDYARFAQMLLNEGTVGKRQFLKPETVHLMSSLQTGNLQTGFTPGNGWGLGVGLVREPQGVTQTLSPGTFGHGGTFGTQAWIDPVNKVVYLLLVQRNNFPNGDDSTVRRAFQKAAATALNEPPQ